MGQTELKTGEIGDDLTWYFANSEQTPSAVGLGVLMEKNNTVKQAGGFILQLMPFTEEAVIGALEKSWRRSRLSPHCWRRVKARSRFWRTCWEIWAWNLQAAFRCRSTVTAARSGWRRC